MTEPETIAMSRCWDDLARLDPRFFIATEERDWDDEAFFESGRQIVDQVMAWVDQGADQGAGRGAGRGAGPDTGPAVGRRRMLEIGCGLGRLVLHFARHFDEAVGIDVSTTMIEQAQARELPENVRLQLGSGRDLAPVGTGEVDFVYSALVFQHIPDVAVIDAYLREIRRVLVTEGCAVLHFDTRPARMIDRLYKALPDPLLPRTHRKYIRRYRRAPERLEAMMRDAHLAVVDERYRGTADHLFLLRPTTIA